MTQENDKSDKPKRKRGRPVGSIKNPGDDAALKKLAEHRVDQPHAPFASLARELGYKSESEIKRLQRKWNARKEGLLQTAERERNAFEELDFLGKVTFHLGISAEWVRTALNTLPIEQFRQSIASAAEKKRALKELGIAPEPPFDIADPVKIASAIVRFEMREIMTLDDLTATYPEAATVHDLPLSQIHYTQALIFYELSLDARAKEDRQRLSDDLEIKRSNSMLDEQ